MKSKILKIIRNVFGISFWLFVPTKLFILDIDLLIIRLTKPDLIWLLEWKFIFISLLVILFILVFGVKEFAKAMFFILFYPLIFPSVKLFNYFKKNSGIVIKFLQRNYFPILVFITNYLSNIYKHFRFRLIVSYLFILCLFIIYNTKKPLVYIICSWIMFFYLLVHYSYRIYIATKPSPFFNKILSLFDNGGSKTNDSYFTNIKRFEEAAVFSFLLVKGKEFLRQIKTTPYLILYFTLSFIYSIVITIITLGSLHYTIYQLDNVSYSISNYHTYLFYLLGLNSLLSLDTSLIIPKGEISNLLITFGGLLKWLLSLIYGVFLFNILKSHYNYTLDQILNRFEIEEGKIQLLLKEKYNKDMDSAIKEIEKSFDPNSPINFKSSKITEAKLLIRENKYEDAFLTLESLDEKKKNDFEVHYLLGYLYGKKGNYEQMILNYDKSLSISEQYKSDIEASKKYYWATIHNDGIKYFNNSKDQTDDNTKRQFMIQSMKKFELACLIIPDAKETLENLVYTKINLGLLSEAKNLLIDLVNLYGQEDHFEILISLLFELRDTVKLTEIIKKGLEKYPNNEKLNDMQTRIIVDNT